MVKPIISLLSGGIDSTVVLALLANNIENRKKIYTISFDYGQKHKIELEAAKNIAAYYETSHRTLTIDPSIFDHSSLLENSQDFASFSSIPSTYVPGRNTLFLTYAMIQCELLGAEEIHFGANQMDFEAYPDCRPPYFKAFQEVINISTRQALEHRAPQIITPLLQWNKSEIIKKGLELQAPLHLTWSCYQPNPNKTPCHTCLACTLRKEGWDAIQQT